jgi:hypothetical protein
MVHPHLAGVGIIVIIAVGVMLLYDLMALMDFVHHYWVNK